MDDQLELAVDLYSQAIAINPNNAELFADRAQANIKLNNFTEAVADATKAIELELLDSLLFTSLLRKATALIKLQEYHAAKADLEAAASLAPGDSRFTNLINQCQERIAAKSPPISATLDNLNFLEIANDEGSSAQEILNMHNNVAKNFISRAYVTFFNEATKDEIEKIKQLGPQRASNIVAQREDSPYKTLLDLDRVGLSENWVNLMMAGEMEELFTQTKKLAI